MSNTEPPPKFGFIAECGPGRCPPETETFASAFHLGLPFFVIVVVVSLVAGFNFSKNRLLATCAMLAVAAIFIQVAKAQIELITNHHYRLISDIQRGNFSDNNGCKWNDVRLSCLPAVEANRRTDKLRKSSIEVRYLFRRMHIKGWLAYSAFPFAAGVVLAFYRRRKKKA